MRIKKRDEAIFINHYSLEEWTTSKRRETLDLILREEYGLRPIESEKPCTYKVVDEYQLDAVKAQKIIMTFMDLEMRVFLFTPIDTKKHKCFVAVLHEYAEDKSAPDLLHNFDNVYFADIKDIISRGYAVVLVPTRDIAPDGLDFKIRRKRDIFATINKVREGHEWGTLNAWAWGMSKAIDYLVTLPNIDKDNIAVIGHSRGGKTALICAAQDERIKLAVSSCSGQSGAAISRYKKGETIGKITSLASYWFATNYFKYAGHPFDVPFDQHQLVGTIAPRYVYILSAKDDHWAGPKNELWCCELASQYFELHGIKGFVKPNKIKINTSYNEGHIAYHIKDGGHCLEPRDWTMVMDYFDKI